MTLQDWSQEDRVLSGIVFEVGVLDQEDISHRLPDPFPQSSSLTAVYIQEEDTNSGEFFAAINFLQPFAGSVGGSVIDNDNLFVDRHLLDPRQNLVDGVKFIKNGNDD